MNWRRLFGSRGEREAASLLRRRGCRILRRNYTCSVGEVDLIASDGEAIIFVEVKTRRSDEAQDPVEAVHREKRRRMKRAAQHFISAHRLHDRPCRFDVIIIVWPPKGRPVIEHYEDAFPFGTG